VATPTSAQQRKTLGFYTGHVPFYPERMSEDELKEWRTVI
jgi:hypothetical protein